MSSYVLLPILGVPTVRGNECVNQTLFQTAESQPSQRDDRGGHRRVVMHCLGCCSGSSAF